jgi:hypothetical protein
MIEDSRFWFNPSGVQFDNIVRCKPAQTVAEI